MATNISRVGAYVPNFTPDNTGRTILQSYQPITATAGTVNLVPNSQINYFNLTNTVSGAMTINVAATYSAIADNGYGQTVNYYNQICDEIAIFLNGGASAQTITYGLNIAGSSATFSTGVNTPTLVRGHFNGTEWIVSHITATK